MNDPARIYGLLTNRKHHDQAAQARAAEIRDTYQGDLIVPLPELNDAERPAVANLVQSAIDQTGMRVASTMPSVIFPPKRFGIKASERKARVSRDVLTGWWDLNKMPLKLRRRARYLLAYGHSPVQLRPTDTGPVWHLRDPLGTYPAPALDPDEIIPPDCIFDLKRSREWLLQMYPDQMLRLRKHDTTRSFEIVEYVDAEDCVTFIVGDTDSNVGYGYTGTTDFEIIHNYPNKTGMPLVADPARITLDRRLGAYDGMIGMYQLQAKIMALNVIGLQRGIFPETWFVTTQAGGQIVRHADPFQGIVGIADAGDIKTVQMQPSFGAGQMVDRLAGEQRIDGGMPAEYSGLSSSNVRTGRRGEQILSNAVDFFIQEAQILFEHSLEAENKMAIALAKAYNGSTSTSLYVKGRGNVTFTPNDCFETDVHEVRYAYAGADANGLTIQIGQKLGLETMSRRTAMELDPLIADVDAEESRIEVESLRRAFMTSLQQMAAQPDGPLLPTDIMTITQLIATQGLEPWEAFDRVQKAAQQRQADQQAQQQQLPAGPEQQPGLNAPAPARPEASVAAPPQALGNVAQLLSSLRRPAMTLPAEEAVGATPRA